jgi:hypothetical protein
MKGENKFQKIHQPTQFLMLIPNMKIFLHKIVDSENPDLRIKFQLFSPEFRKN